MDLQQVESASSEHFLSFLPTPVQEWELKKQFAAAVAAEVQVVEFVVVAAVEAVVVAVPEVEALVVAVLAVRVVLVDSPVSVHQESVK